MTEHDSHDNGTGDDFDPAELSRTATRRMVEQALKDMEKLGAALTKRMIERYGVDRCRELGFPVPDDAEPDVS